MGARTRVNAKRRSARQAQHADASAATSAHGGPLGSSQPTPPHNPRGSDGAPMPACAAKLFQCSSSLETLEFGEIEVCAADVRVFALKPRLHHQLKEVGVPQRLAEILLMQDVIDPAPAHPSSTAAAAAVPHATDSASRSDLRIHRGIVYEQIAVAQALRNMLANDSGEVAGAVDGGGAAPREPSIFSTITVNEDRALRGEAVDRETLFSERLARKVERAWALALAARQAATPSEYAALLAERDAPHATAVAAAKEAAEEEEEEEARGAEAPRSNDERNDVDGDGVADSGHVAGTDRRATGSQYLTMLSLLDELLQLASLCAEATDTASALMVATPPRGPSAASPASSNRHGATGCFCYVLLSILHSAARAVAQNVAHPAQYFVEMAAPSDDGGSNSSSSSSSLAQALRYYKQEETKLLSQVCVSAADLLRALSEGSPRMAELLSHAVAADAEAVLAQSLRAASAGATEFAGVDGATAEQLAFLHDAVAAAGPLQWITQYSEPITAAQQQRQQQQLSLPAASAVGRQHASEFAPTALCFEGKTAAFRLVQCSLYIQTALLHTTAAKAEALTASSSSSTSGGGGGAARSAASSSSSASLLLAEQARSMQQVLPLVAGVMNRFHPQSLWASALPLLLNEDATDDDDDVEDGQLSATIDGSEEEEEGRGRERPGASSNRAHAAADVLRRDDTLQKERRLWHLLAAADFAGAATDGGNSATAAATDAPVSSNHCFLSFLRLCYLHNRDARRHRAHAAAGVVAAATTTTTTTASSTPSMAVTPPHALLQEDARAAAVEMIQTQLRCSQAAARLCLLITTTVCEHNGDGVPASVEATGAEEGEEEEEEDDDETAFHKNPLAGQLAASGALAALGATLQDCLRTTGAAGGASGSPAQVFLAVLAARARRLVTRFTDDNAEVTSLQYAVLSSEVAVWRTASTLMLMLPTASLGSPDLIWHAVLAQARDKFGLYLSSLTAAAAAADHHNGSDSFDGRDVEHTVAECRRLALVGPAVREMLWQQIESLVSMLWTTQRKNAKLLQQQQQQQAPPHAALLVRPALSDMDFFTQLFWSPRADVATTRAACVAVVGLLAVALRGASADAAATISAARFAMAALTAPPRAVSVSASCSPLLARLEQQLAPAMASASAAAAAATAGPSLVELGNSIVLSTTSNGSGVQALFGGSSSSSSSSSLDRAPEQEAWMEMLAAVDAVVSLRCEAANTLMDLFLDETYDSTAYVPLGVHAVLASFLPQLKLYQKKRVQLAKDLRRSFSATSVVALAAACDGAQLRQWSEVAENLSGFVPYKAAHTRV